MQVATQAATVPQVDEGWSTEAKVLVGILIIAVLVAGGYAIWYFLIREKDEDEDAALRGAGGSSNGPISEGRAQVKNNWKRVVPTGIENENGQSVAIIEPYTMFTPLAATPRPHIFTTLAGNGMAHHGYMGKQVVYYDNEQPADTFRVQIEDVNSETAAADGLKLHIMAFGPISASLTHRWIMGQSGSDIWVGSGDRNIVGTIPFPSGKFSSAPRIVTSLACASSCPNIPGASSVYDVTKDGFKMYVPDYTPEGATSSDSNMRVTFFAWEDGMTFDGVTLGSSTSWSAATQGDVEHVVCRITFPTPFAAPPVVITSIQSKDQDISQRPDGGSIFNLTNEGFEVRLYGNYTVATAAEKEVRVNYVARAAN